MSRRFCRTGAPRSGANPETAAAAEWRWSLTSAGTVLRVAGGGNQLQSWGLRRRRRAAGAGRPGIANGHRRITKHSKGSEMATVFPSMRIALTSAPATSNSWTRTGRMAAARDGFTATLLPDGKVLAAGGGDPYAIFASAEVYDPVTGTWSHTAAISTLRDIHVAALLDAAGDLVPGGVTGRGVR